MIRSIKLITLFALGALVVSCESGSEKTTESGVNFTVVKGGGEEIADSSYLLLNLSFQDANDSVWMNTADNGFPTPVLKYDSLWANGGAVNQVFNELGKGDSVTFDVTGTQLFVETFNRPIPPEVDSADVFTFKVGVSDVLDQQGFRSWQQEMMVKQRAKQAEKAEEQLQEDIQTIDAYLAENNIEATETESGLRYVITEEGDGPQAEVGDTVRVNYVGKVMNGDYFDTSFKEIAQEKGLYDERREPYEPFQLTLGKGMVIKGWDEGIAYLKEGGKATLYIPSPLAYGPRARGASLPANSILIFDVELVEVK